MENTTKNNKLLAEFLGFELTTDSISILYYTEDRGLKQLPKFHSDWNWLMQVVEKIESLGFETSLTNQNFFIRIAGGNTQSGIMYKNKIEAVYNACVEFVKWYNKNNK